MRARMIIDDVSRRVMRGFYGAGDGMNKWIVMS